MKRFAKAGLILLGIGWTLYWLAGKAAAPLAGIRSRRKAKKEQLAEYEADKDL